VKEGLIEYHFVGYQLKEVKTTLEEKVTPPMEIYLNMGLNIMKIARS